VKTETEYEGKSSQSQESLLGFTYVMCASKTCPAPRYHLTCSGVPKGSQIFRNSIVTCHTTEVEAIATNMSVGRKYSAEHILERLYSSSERAWWDLLPDQFVPVDGGKYSKNWPTSSSSFMCPSCDVEGRSRYLLEYFERFHTMKKSFYAGYLRGENSDDMDCRLNRVDESVEARTGEAFLWHLMKDNRRGQTKKGEGGDKNEELIWNSSEIQLKHMADVLAFLSKQLQQQQMQQQQRRQKRQKTKFQLDPSYLVGMPIRLFNPIDNSYHSGRVLDYKVNAPYQYDQLVSNLNVDSSAPAIGQLTDEKISGTLYLVRFRQGAEGRKIAVHEWIYLEEHAASIGGEICWARVGHHSGDVNAGSPNEKARDSSSDTHVLKSNARLHAQRGDYVSQYRPVQIIFRTMLEMIPVQNLNPAIACAESKKSCMSIRRDQSTFLNVLAMGFGKAFCHVRLSLGDCGISPMNESQLVVAKTRGFEKYTKAATTTSPSSPNVNTAVESPEPEVIPLTNSNPSWIDQSLHHVLLSDEDVALGLGMACMEKEEERRVRTWCNLSVSHLFQPSFSKTSIAISSATKQAITPNTEPKKCQVQFRTTPTKSPSLSTRLHLDNDISLEFAASLGCAKCMNEMKTGVKTHRSHKGDCPRRRKMHPVSLEVAASLGCTKCVREIKTGIKTRSSHDESCPRRRSEIKTRTDPLKEDDAGGESIELSFSPCCSKLLPPLHETKSQMETQKLTTISKKRAL